jgi:hypothetical protein
MVHSGFLNAWDSVKVKVRAMVDRLAASAAASARQGLVD